MLNTAWLLCNTYEQISEQRDSCTLCLRVLQFISLIISVQFHRCVLKQCQVFMVCSVSALTLGSMFMPTVHEVPYY